MGGGVILMCVSNVEWTHVPAAQYQMINNRNLTLKWLENFSGVSFNLCAMSESWVQLPLVPVYNCSCLF